MTKTYTPPSKNTALILAFITSVICIVSLDQCMQSWIHTYSFFYLIIWILEFICIYNIACGHIFKTNREIICYSFFSTIFCFFFLLGLILEKQHLDAATLLFLCISSVGGGSLVTHCLPSLFELLARIFVTVPAHLQFKMSERKQFAIFSIIIFICWIPVFLAYYPGIFSYDVASQIPQITEGQYSTHHPLLHTLLMGSFYQLGGIIGNYNIGISMYTLIQMIFFSMTCSYILLFLRRRNLSIVVQIVCLIILSFYPSFSMMSISMTKDIIFTGFAILLMCSLSYFGLNDNNLLDKKKILLYLFSIIGFVLFRNNGLYIMLFVIVSGFLYFKKQSKKRFILITLLGLFISVSVNSLLASTLNAKEGSINEMLTIPYQQLANTYINHKEDIPVETAEKILRFLPDIDQYDPAKSDMIKVSGKAFENWGDFLRLYIELFTQYPCNYLEGFLLTNQGYWYIDDFSSSMIYGRGFEIRHGYYMTDTREGFGIEHISYLPFVEKVFEHLFIVNKYQYFPVLAVFFSLALYFWLIILAFFISLAQKRRCTILFFGFIFGLLLTLFAGPCVLVRYALPYICAIPIAYAITMHDNLA